MRPILWARARARGAETRQYTATVPARAGLLLACALSTGLTGCNSTVAALGGGPRISDSAWIGLGAPPSAGSAGGTGPTNRDFVPPECNATSPVIKDCVDAMVLLIDVRWYEFEKGLVATTNGTNFVLDVAGLGLNATGALSGQSASQILHAVAGGLSGTRTALNNDVLLQHSVTVLVHQMQTDRAQALQVILTRENPDASNHYTTLREAAIDLYAFALAGTWSNALTSLETCTASQAQAGHNAVIKAKTSGTTNADSTDTNGGGGNSSSSDGCAAPSNGGSTLTPTAAKKQQAATIAGAHAHAGALKLRKTDDEATAAAADAKHRAADNIAKGESLGDAVGDAVHDTLSERAGAPGQRLGTQLRAQIKKQLDPQSP